MFSPKLVKNFLTQEECDYLVNLVKDIEPWETGGSDFWNNRSLNGITLYNNIDKVAGTLIYNIRNKIKETIRQEYSLPNEVYPDLCQIVRWFPGQEQHPHADDMKNTEGNDWFHHRDYGAIIYLNDDYDGGHTYYPNYNFDIQKLYLEMFLSDAETFVRCQNIFDPLNFDQRLQNIATFINKYVDEYKVMPEANIVNASTGSDLNPVQL